MACTVLSASPSESARPSTSGCATQLSCSPTHCIHAASDWCCTWIGPPAPSSFCGAAAGRLSPARQLCRAWRVSACDTNELAPVMAPQLYSYVRFSVKPSLLESAHGPPIDKLSVVHPSRLLYLLSATLSLSLKAVFHRLWLRGSQHGYHRSSRRHL